MPSVTARTALLAAFLATPALAQETTTETDSMAADTGAMAADAGTPPELADASLALDAATSLGLVEVLASGDAYTAFIPTNAAIEAVQGDETTAVMADETAFSTLVQGYVVEGTVLAADAIGMVEDEGGTHTATSLAGTPLELALDGDTLTVNGAAVTTPDITLGNVTIHLIDAAFLPEAAGTTTGADAMATDGMATDDAMATDGMATDDAMATEGEASGG